MAGDQSDLEMQPLQHGQGQDQERDRDTTQVYVSSHVLLK